MATAITDKTSKDAANAKPELILLEEDDFEEFVVEGWDGKDEEPSEDNVWEDDWDDDNVEDDFAVQLKKFGRKRPAPTNGHSSPISSSEPRSKKMCVRPSPNSIVEMVDVSDSTEKTTEASAESSNGHASNGDSTPTDESNNRTRSGTRSSSRASSSTRAESPRTPTRSSARLRSARR